MSGTRPPYPTRVTRRSLPPRLTRFLALVLFLVPGLLGTAHAAVYTWTDADGGVHYGDRPTGVAARELRIDPDANVTSKAAARTRARVAEVFDGDTIALESGRLVRLVGINAPETAKQGKPGEPGGEAATRALRDWIEGRWITVEPGPEREDRYGRMLAFIHDDRGRLVNAELLREGLAHSYFFLPRIIHERALLEAEAEARAAGRGIWSGPAGQLQTPQSLRDAANSFRQVRGRVSHERRQNGVRFVFLDRVLGLRIADNLDSIPGSLIGRTVVARGKVRSRKKALWMDIRHPSQLLLEPADSQPLRAVQDKGRADQ
ncbi:MAG: thermonuclease family protein [Gammaproteobacteria bacterium]